MKIKPIDKAGGVVVELGPKETQLPPQASGTAAANPPVFQLKKILVPVDFSACSKKALQYAIPFAKQFSAELTLLYVVQPYVPVAGMTEMTVVVGESAQDAQKNLQALQKMVGDAVPSKTLVRTGNPYIEITCAAKDLDIDLIILSTHGRTGLEHVLVGSTTEKVVRHARCPVLIVREHEHEFIVDYAANPTKCSI